MTAEEKKEEKPQEEEKDKKPTWEDKKEEGNLRFRYGDYEKAIQLFTDALGDETLPQDQRHLIYSNRSAAHSNVQK